MAWDTGVQFQVESYQRLKKKKKKNNWYLMSHGLTHSIIKNGSG